MFEVDAAGASGVGPAERETYQRLRSLVAGSVVDDARPLPDLVETAGAWQGRLSLFRRPTPFYPGYALYRLQRSWPAQAGTLEKNGHVLAPAEDGAADRPFAILDGTSPPIHRINHLLQDGRQITAETAIDYLKFFCEFVHGEQGAFYLLEGADDLRWREDAGVDPERQEILLRCMQVPVRAASKTEPPAEDEAIHCIATVHYGKAVFLAGFDVHSTGMIEMTQDHPLVSELPVRPHRWDEQGRLLTSGGTEEESRA